MHFVRKIFGIIAIQSLLVVFSGIFFVYDVLAANPQDPNAVPLCDPYVAQKCPTGLNEQESNLKCKAGETPICTRADCPLCGGIYCCKPTYKIDSQTAACSNKKIVQCHAEGTFVNPTGISDAYMCLDSAEECKGENIGSGIQTGCKGGVAPQVCCKVPLCAESSSVSGQTSGAQATTAPTGKTYTLTNPLGPETSIERILGRVIGAFLGIIGAFALLAFVYAGVIWMTARGDKNNVKKAQDMMKATATGLFIIGFAYTLTSTFLKLFTTIPPQAATENSPIGDATTADLEQAGLETNLEQQAAEDAINSQQGVPEGKVRAKICGKMGTIPKEKIGEYLTYICVDPASPHGSCMAVSSGSDPCADVGQKCCAPPSNTPPPTTQTLCEKTFGSTHACRQTTGQADISANCKQINGLCNGSDYCCLK